MTDNPYAATDTTETRSSLPSHKTGNQPILMHGFAIVCACSFVGGVIGTVVGYALGAVVPAYYESIYSHASQSGNFDAVSVGVGLGLTQGIVFGAVLGLALVALYYWYLTRQA